MILPTYTPKSAKPTTTKVSDKVFGGKINPILMAQAIRVYLSNQRQGTKHAKTRGEVHGTGKKIYRQKGTGRARHGDRLAPIFVKGGVAHGPKGTENYTRKLTRTLRGQALISALSAKAKAKKIVLLDKIGNLTKTKLMSELMAKISTPKKHSRIALIVDSTNSPLIRVAKNLSSVSLYPATQITTYDIIKHHTIAITSESLPMLEKRIQK